MTPAEVAALFRVDPKTVTRWADAGKLTAVRTLGGHRRYLQDEVQNLLVASSLMLTGTNKKSSEVTST
jgi:excisionase family DNA binding protein